jgi:hypothetical protein
MQKQNYKEALELIQKITEAFDSGILFFDSYGNQLFDVKEVLDVIGNGEEVKLVSSPNISVSDLN